MYVIAYTIRMNSKRTLSTTDARKKLFQLTKEVQTPGINYTFTEGGKPKAVLMSAEEFESWQETLDVMSNSPTIMEDIRAAEAEHARGEFVALSEILKEDATALVVTEKKAKYVSGRNPQKRGEAKKKATRSAK